MRLGERLRAVLFSLPPKIPRLYWSLALIAWTATLTILAVGHGPRLPPAPWSSFLWNFTHAPAYGLLAPLCLYSLPRVEQRIEASTRNLLISWSVVLLVGIANEGLQGMTDDRRFSLWDWASDAAGGIVFLGFIHSCRDEAPSTIRVFLYAALSLLLCAAPAWVDSFGLSF